MSQKCAICEVVDDGEFIQPKVIGINTINKASNERGDKLGLSVTLHRYFGSRYLIDMLHKLGFCSSYTEVQRFENCA